MRVVPILFRADNIQQSERECLDLETGTILDCADEAADIRWFHDPVDGWMLQGANGTTLAPLGKHDSLDSVGYQNAASSSLFRGQILVGDDLAGGTLLVARTNEGRLSKILVRSITDVLQFDVVTYLE